MSGDDSWLRLSDNDLEERPADDDWRAEAFVEQTESQHQLIGALLWLPATRVRAILELVPDTAIWRPRARWAYQLIRTLVAAGHDPDPVAVLDLARTQPSTFALSPDRPPTAHQLKGLAIYLFDAYQDAIAPRENAGQYARDVLDTAYRNAFRDHAIRMQELAECDVERELLTQLFIDTRDDLAELRRRAEAAAKPGWNTP
ncbi:hypothetical protein AWB98_27065 [Mycolicibacterium conceptionense]|uniref:DNA helicase DnaB-like N-terminal domain-containing protein n=1 Tax=Mycolicibacterium conceptionense TaxID=451644 RepID=A0ABX3V0X9_9MYCO|nr:hypothetical protein AWB98_27065 [Mycolicibacterium conceptionense]